MTTQNLVSAILPDELKESILQLLDQLSAKLTFLISISPEEIKGVVRAGDGYSPFLDRAHQTIKNYPQIVSPLFDKEEFEKDYLFASALEPIYTKLNSINEGVRNTLIAAMSDTMSSSLKIYSAAQDNKDKIPGLNAIVDEMAKFFKKTRTPKDEKK
jgi:hypothetical protein